MIEIESEGSMLPEFFEFLLRSYVLPFYFCIGIIKK
jgi:hypothetical protein